MNGLPSSRVSRVHQLLAPWVKKAPDSLALQDPFGSFSYAGLDQASMDAAAVLRGFGVAAGDRVLIVGENCAAIAVFVLALSRLDAWFCVVNGRLSTREIDSIASHAKPRRILYTSHVSPEAREHALRHGAQTLPWGGVELHLGPLDAASPSHATSPAGDTQVAALIYTSGTSGAPKGVMLTHANLAFAAGAARTVRGIGPGDTVYGVLPMAHVVGLSSQFLGTLASGAALVLEPRFSPAALARAFEAGVTAFTGVPAMYTRLLEWMEGQGGDLNAPRLRLIGVAGAPLTDLLKSRVEKALKLPLLNGYGLTETSPTIAQVAPDAVRADCSVGPPIPGVEVRIVGAQATQGKNEKPGELWVRGPHVMKGYYRDEALTAASVDADGWFNTGDMATQGPDGALYIVGRSKELIIRSGFNVYPVEVEQVINSYPGVAQSAVVGRTVGDNEEVVAFVEVPAGTSVDESDLRQFLRERLSPYKLPAEIRFMPHLPAAPTGKLLKGVMKALAEDPALPRPGA